MQVGTIVDPSILWSFLGPLADLTCGFGIVGKLRKISLGKCEENGSTVYRTRLERD